MVKVGYSNTTVVVAQVVFDDLTFDIGIGINTKPKQQQRDTKKAFEDLAFDDLALHWRMCGHFNTHKRRNERFRCK